MPFERELALEIILFPHPTLRHPSKSLKRVDAQLKKLVEEMFELMYAHRGVGLAANQVDLPIRLFVMNSSGSKGDGEERVFINPVLSRPKGIEENEEGCLSLPGLHGDVKRSKSVQVNAYDLSGNEINETFDGFKARIVQHETDHLDGVLFIDRMVEGAVRKLAPELSNLETDFRSKQRLGGIQADEDLLKQLKTWEEKFC